MNGIGGFKDIPLANSLFSCYTQKHSKCIFSIKVSYIWNKQNNITTEIVCPLNFPLSL